MEWGGAARGGAGTRTRNHEHALVRQLAALRKADPQGAVWCAVAIKNTWGRHLTTIPAGGQHVIAEVDFLASVEDLHIVIF